MFLDGYKRNWLMTEGYSFEDMMIDDLSVSLACSINPVPTQTQSAYFPVSVCEQKALEVEGEEEEEEQEAKPDPLHQLILHFSRTALTEKT